MTVQPQPDMVEALLLASRALVAVAARSLADADGEVTLPQFRALMVLATRGPQRIVDISTELGVTPSTGTRMCDRLVRKRLIRRTRVEADRRAVRLTLTTAGRALVSAVTRRRRDELSRIVAAIPAEQHRALTPALMAFAAAAGEVRDPEWWLGWMRGPLTPDDQDEGEADAGTTVGGGHGRGDGRDGAVYMAAPDTDTYARPGAGPGGEPVRHRQPGERPEGTGTGA